MPVDAETQKAIEDAVKAGVASVAGLLAPENLAKVITPIIEAQNKANGVLTKAELEAREAAAKKAAEDKAKADAEAAAKAKADEDAKGKGKGKDEPPAPDPKVAELEKRLAEQEARAKAAEEASKAAAEKARTDALHDSARTALRKAGIPEDRIPLAMAVVKDRAALAYDGDRPGWKGTDPKTNTPGILDMEAAAKAWADSAEGKVFLPPAGAGGTGEGGGNRAGAGLGGDASLSSVRQTSGGSILNALASLG